MATKIALKHKTSGIIKDGFYGFSWTTFFFGGFPALFRGDFLTFMGTFVVLFLLGIGIHPIVIPLAMLAWAFFYNSYYTKKLLEKGYELNGTDSENSYAAAELGIVLSSIAVQDFNFPKKENSIKIKFSDEEKTLNNDAYKIYLVKKYPIEFNEVLKKYIFNNKIYESVDDALIDVHEFEKSDQSQSPISEAINILNSHGMQVVKDGSGSYFVKDPKRVGSTNYFDSDDEIIKFAKHKSK